MTLLGEGIICIWNDIKEGGVDSFYAWHDNEHVPERVGIPGFLRGRRYVTDEAGAIRWLTLYETLSPQVLDGQDYLNRLNNPTAWTREAVRHFANVLRGLTRKEFSLARGDGGLLLAYALSLEGDLIEARRRFTGDLLPRLYAEGGLAGVHWLETNQEASRIETAEKRGREGGTIVPDAAVLVEASRAAPLATTRAALDAAVREHPGVAPICPPAIYRLEYQKLKLVA